MDFASLAEQPLALHLHLGSAVLAIFFGPFALYRRRRDRLHKILGYVWVAAMLTVSLSSFALTAAVVPLGFGFGIIHLLSLWLLVGLWRGVSLARAKRIAEHQGQMRGLYWQALGIAGVFTLLPGRVLNDVFFAKAPLIGIGALFIGLIVLLYVGRMKPFDARLAGQPVQR